MSKQDILTIKPNDILRIKFKLTPPEKPVREWREVFKIKGISDGVEFAGEVGRVAYENKAKVHMDSRRTEELSGHSSLTLGFGPDEFESISPKRGNRTYEAISIPSSLKMQNPAGLDEELEIEVLGDAKEEQFKDWLWSYDFTPR